MLARCTVHLMAHTFWGKVHTGRCGCAIHSLQGLYTERSEMGPYTVFQGPLQQLKASWNYFITVTWYNCSGAGRHTCDTWLGNPLTVTTECKFMVAYKQLRLCCIMAWQWTMAPSIITIVRKSTSCTTNNGPNSCRSTGALWQTFYGDLCCSYVDTVFSECRRILCTAKPSCDIKREC